VAIALGSVENLNDARALRNFGEEALLRLPRLLGARAFCSVERCPLVVACFWGIFGEYSSCPFDQGGLVVGRYRFSILIRTKAACLLLAGGFAITPGPRASFKC